ncbi:MAG: hypothetical protein QG671_2401 [Actinomycetota bacterium]|nr:hypothetical protein [Actinomycetota bacterium]
MTTLAHNLASLPPGLLTIPDTLNEQKLDPTQDPGSGFLLTGDNQWSVASTITTPILKASLPAYCPRDEQGAQTVLHAHFELDSWLSARAYGAGRPSSVGGGPPGVDHDAIAELLSKPEQTQAAWARDRIKVITGTPCA